MGLGKLFQDYFNVFIEFGSHILKESDKMIGYYVFEETDINIGFCSKRILLNLLDVGIIDEFIYEKSDLLFKKFRALENTSLWNLDSVKSSPEWREVLELSDEIKQLIEIKWTPEEIQAIFEFTDPTNLGTI